MMVAIRQIREQFISSLALLYDKKEIESIAFLVLQHVLKMDKITLILNQDHLILSRHADKINAILKRLLNREPVQYILCRSSFYSLDLEVNKYVLIPRPETEELVHGIINLIHLTKREKTIKILDIGTGSGCIAIALKKNLEHADVFACDVSQPALMLAGKNAESNQAKITFFHADILSLSFNTSINESFDVIVSNPPYVCLSEKNWMRSNVLDFEPHLALFVPDEAPLLFYHKIMGFAKEKLNRGGYLFFEINETMGERIREAFIYKGFREVCVQKDLKEKDRIAWGCL